MEKKLTQKTWFIVLMSIIIFPVGIYFIWKNKEYKKNNKIIATVAILIFVTIVLLSGEKYTITYTVNSASETYMTEDIPAVEAQYQDPVPMELGAYSGEYLIGQSPSEYVTGTEAEFTTAQSGNYTAGTDFNPGVYDIEVVSGTGNVMGTGLNEIMGNPESDLLGLDDFYISKYDNHVFEEGDTLEVSGVSVKLVPQNEDTFVIPAGTYNIEAIDGGGNVIGSGINEIMGTADKNDLIDMYVPNYDNAQLEAGKTLKVTGVKLSVTPTEPILITEATEAIAGHEITETLKTTEKGETCYIDDEAVECSTLAKYDNLKANLQPGDEVKEKLTISSDKETCYSDANKIPCEQLLYYEELEAQKKVN